jgi:hypothetical protein
MPSTQVLFFKNADGSVPVWEWLSTLRKTDLPAWARCTDRIELLREFGYELRRPAADILRDGIYELRARRRHVNLRILYFFHGRNIAILAHAITKEDRIPPNDLQRAIDRKALFQHDPKKHTYEQSI